MKPPRLLAFLLLGLAPVASLEAQEFRWLAFGDSITQGDFDFANKGGYPGRLNVLLNCSPGICEVFNGGKSGEKSYEAVTRIGAVLNNQGPFDVMLLMEGTNDIFMNLSVESVRANLATIANKAEGHKVETVHSSIIWFHPNGDYGTSKNAAVKSLRDKVANLAQNSGRSFVDNWDELCPWSHTDVHGHNQSTCFSQHYSDVCAGRPPPCGDNRGHPIGSGYDMMANRWYQRVKPSLKPAKPALVSPVGTVLEFQVTLRWNAASGASWYRLLVQSSSGTVVDQKLEASSVCSSGVCTYSSPLLSTGDFTWKVRSRNPSGWSSWSSNGAFTIPAELLFVDGVESGSTSAWDSAIQ
jgi:lysophospholipase L1-like esterase